MSDHQTDDRLRGRADVNRYWFWLLTDANRWLLAAAVTVGVFLAFMLFGSLKDVPLTTTMAESDMVETLFAGMISAIITGTTLVVSIAQLVLSQEIESLGSQRSRMDRNMDVRQRTNELVGGVSSVHPAAYLDELIATTEQRAQRLHETLAGTDQQSLREGVAAYVTELLENAEHARGGLEDAEFGTFDVVSPALDYNYGRKMYDLERLASSHEASLTESQQSAFDDLLTAVTMYAVVREYVKDLYIQWALVKLSRGILYAAVVALIVSGGMVVFVDVSTFPGTFLGVERMLWVVSAAFAVSTLPFVLFTAYILRLATVAKQTLSMGPLVLR